MAGIRDLNITFQIDGNRSARNKLSKMGGIMSSSEELMQAAEPMIKNIVSSIDSNELVPQWNKSAQLDGETAIGRPSGFLPGTTIPDPRSTFRKRMDI
jgi:hypothetical protein